jgi:hypothetical protein
LVPHRGLYGIAYRMPAADGQAPRRDAGFRVATKNLTIWSKFGPMISDVLPPNEARAKQIARADAGQ